MKIQILQENLAKGLTIASRTVSTKAQLPILANILLEAKNSGFFVSATNLEMGVNLNLGAKIEKEGKITIPARVFTEVVSSLPAGKIDLEVEGSLLKIFTSNYQATFNGIPAEEFPRLPTYKEEELISLPADKLLEAIDKVAFAAATDDTRPVLTGVMFKIEGKSLSLVATDGYRLSLKNIGLSQNVEKNVSLLLPAKSLIEVGRVISEGRKEKEIKIGFTEDQNQVVFIFSEMELFTRLIDGDFPDYQKIIPVDFKTKISVDKESLAREVKVVSIFARESANILKIKYNKDFLEMSANSPQVGENKSTLEAKVEGEEGEIAFNFRFLQSFLGVVEEGEVTLEFSGSLSPGVFRSTKDESFLHIIMPIRLQTEEI